MIRNIQVGDKYAETKKVTEKDIMLFAQASGDTNPLHLNEDYAKKTIFGQRIAHGMLSASYISAILGTKLPGEGSIYLSQSLQFKRPVHINDEITTMVEVVKIENNRVTLKTVCMNQKGKIVVDGEALIQLPGDNNDL